MTVYKMVRFTDEEAFGNKERPPSHVTELIQQRDAAIRDRDAARQSRARLVYGIREWRARLIHYGHRMGVRSMLAHSENHRLQTELDTARAQVQRLREVLTPVKEYLENNDMTYYVIAGTRHDNEMYVNICDALRETEPQP